METWQVVVLWAMKAFVAFLVLPILGCWLLFGIAWLKGWSRPDITPAEILDRLGRTTK